MANNNSSYRVKRIKHRPVDSRERLPSEADSVGGKVFVYFGGSPQWRAVSLAVTLLWAKRYTLYWSPMGRAS